MNKHIVSIALLLSVASAPLIVADQHSILPGGCVVNSLPEINDVLQVHWESNFSVKTNLTVTPTNWEQWELVDHRGLKLISYQLVASNLVGSAGSQEWVFKPQSTGLHQITFKRTGEVKTVPVYVYCNDGYNGWCGTADIINKKTPITITF